MGDDSRKLQAASLKESELVAYGLRLVAQKSYFCRVMSIQQDNRFQAIISHAKEYGFVFPSSEIYDGLSAVYDYGPYGSELKKNIRDYWWRSMTQMHDNIVGIDAAIFMHPTTWKASGHVDNFSDPMIDNKDSKKDTGSIICLKPKQIS